MAAAVNVMDMEWAKEGAAMGGPGTPKRPALVGGAGMFGSNLLVLLAHAPGVEKIKVVDVRPPSPLVLADLKVNADRIEFVKHALGTDSLQSLTEAVKGCDCVFSMVTPDVWRAKECDFYRTNAHGSKLLVAACEDAGVSSLVHLSSIAAKNHRIPCEDLTEDAPLPALETYMCAYDISKRMSEEVILNGNGHGKLATVALRPGGILSSPFDYTFQNVIVVRGLTCTPFSSSPIDFIDVRDLCRGVFMAAQALMIRKDGVAGQLFNLTKGESIRPHEFGLHAARHLGWFVLRVPNSLIHLTAFFSWLGFKGRKALGLPVNGFPMHLTMTYIGHEQTFSNEKAERLLGFRSKITLDESIKRSCELYVKVAGNNRSQIYGAWGLSALFMSLVALGTSTEMRRHLRAAFI